MTLYVNDTTGRIACFKHVGHTAQSSIETRRRGPYRGIDGSWTDVDTYDNGDTLRNAFADAGLAVECESC